MKKLRKYLSETNVRFFWDILTHDEKQALEKAGIKTPFLRLHGRDKENKPVYKAPKSYTYAKRFNLGRGRYVVSTVDVIVKR